MIPAISRYFPVHPVLNNSPDSVRAPCHGQLLYRRAMGTIRPQQRSVIRLFLRSLADWKPGGVEPVEVHEERRKWARTVLELLGEDCPDDLEMMALESLARAALALCADPQDADVIASMQEAGRSLLEISQLSS